MPGFLFQAPFAIGGLHAAKPLAGIVAGMLGHERRGSVVVDALGLVALVAFPLTQGLRSTADRETLGR